MDKSKIKRDYKQAKQPMGIYQIVIAGADQSFIGCATDLKSRFNRHRAELKFGSHRNLELQQLWNSLGESAVEFRVLDILEYDENNKQNSREELQLLLDMWIQKLEKDKQTLMEIK